MADDVPKLASHTPVAQARALLRREGYTSDEIEAMSDDKVSHVLRSLNNQLDLRVIVEEALPQMIADGDVTELQARELPYSDLYVMWVAWSAVRGYHKRRGQLAAVRAQVAAAPVPKATAVPVPTTADLMPVLGDMLAVMAGRATEIRQLRQEVYRLRDTNVAVFGEQRVLDQVRAMSDTHDVHGFTAERCRRGACASAAPRRTSRSA